MFHLCACDSHINDILIDMRSVLSQSLLSEDELFSQLAEGLRIGHGFFRHDNVLLQSCLCRRAWQTISDC